MQCTRSASSTPMGRDPDARWVQWLALTRRNNPASPFGAMSPSSSTSSLPMACSSLNDRGRVRSRSSATSYFALLSAAEDAHQHQHQRQQGRKHYNSTARHMDSSWVAWLNERGQRQVHCPGQSRSPCEPPVQSQPQPQTCLPDSTVMPGSPLTTTPPSMVSSAATPFPSPLAPLTAAEMDALSQQFPDLADGFSTDEMGEFDPAELDAGLLTWLDEQHAFAINPGEEGPVSPSKRCLSPEGSAECIKKQKVYHEVYTVPGKRA